MLPPRLQLAISGAAVAIATVTVIADAHGIPAANAFIIPMLVAACYGPACNLTQWFLRRSRWRLPPGRAAAAYLAGLMPLALNLPYLWYRSGAASAASVEFVANSVTIGAELVLGAAAVAVMLRLLAPADGPDTGTRSEHPWRILAPAIVVWAVLGSVLSILMHRFMHEPGPNTTMVLQGLSNIFDDQGPLYAEVLQAEGSSILGVHANFIFFLLYPFYRLIPRYETILVLGQVCMAAAVVPLYRLARARLSYHVSLLVAFIYLANPVIAGSGPTQDMSELRFLAFPFFMSLYFFEKKRFWPFALFASLAVITREDVGLLYLLLGVYALFIRRGWQWSLVPMAFGAAWFAVMTNFVIPHFNPAGKFTRLEVVYEEYGGTQLGLLKHLLTHPWDVFRRTFANASTIGLTYGLWQTVGLGIPVLSGMILLVFPGMAELLLLESGARPSINSHHAIIIAVPLFAALVFGLARFDVWSHRFPGLARGRLTLVAAVLMLFSAVSAFHIWFNPDRYQPRYNYSEARELMELVPDDASVVLPMYLLIHSDYAQAAVGYYQIAYRVDQDIDVLQEDYVLIDTNVPEELKDLRVYSGLASLRDALGGSGDYEIMAAKDDLILYVRKEAGPADTPLT